MRLLILISLVGLFLAPEACAASRGTTCNCGWTNRGRIVGGQETKKNEYPWTAALYDGYNKIVHCGASIITQFHAITAAHCGSAQAYGVVLLVGAHNPNLLDGTMVPIEKWILHPSYEKRAPVSDDIAVLVTRTPIPMGPNVGPVCLPKERYNMDYQRITLIGWGKQSGLLPASPVLKKVDVTVLPFATCKPYWNLPYPQSQICIMEHGRGSCMGDSGGPWVWMDPETARYTLIGVTSFGNKMCDASSPTVSTEVAYYMPWVRSIIQATKPAMVCTKV